MLTHSLHSQVCGLSSQECLQAEDQEDTDILKYNNSLLIDHVIFPI